jgi:glycosyltransferase involved in cell wall biosynthesis
MKIAYLGNIQSPHLEVFYEYFSQDNEVHIFGWREPRSDASFHFHDISPLKKRNSGVSDNVGSDKKFGVSKKRIPSPLKTAIKLRDYHKIRKRIRKIDPDMIHGHEAKEWGLQTAYVSKKPRILTCWGSDVLWWPRESRLVNLKVKKALERVDLIHVTHPYTGKHIEDFFGMDGKKIRVIPWGFDASRFLPENLNPDILVSKREQYGIAENDRVILYPKGFRDNRRQNFLNLIRGFRIAAGKERNLKMIMLSYGKSDSYDRIMSLINDASVKDRVIIVDSLIPNQEMAYMYAMSDIIAMIPDSDQFSIIITESMITGCIPLLSRIPQYEYTLKHGRDCFFADRKDPADIAEKIDYIIENIEEIEKRMIPGNRMRAMRNVDRKVQMPKIMEMYRELVD